jgi:SHS2 domain-containing protein
MPLATSIVVTDSGEDTSLRGIIPGGGGRELKPFEFVTHTADAAVIVRGSDIEALLRNGAAALYEFTLGPREIGVNCCQRLSVEASGAATLVVDWMNELLYYLYVEHLAFSQFEFDRATDSSVVARCRGAVLDFGKAGPIREVKAATYHMANLVPSADGYEIRVVLDV